jgi:glycolate oxidase iron-sulfur subunit
MPSGDTGFDDHRPPAPELLADCVHCGFCLPTCPTYLLWGEEMDSPRGRIELMRQASDGQPLDAAVVGHFDACLGCMACVTACPSGVQYDALIEATRSQVERLAPDVRSPADRAFRRLIFALFPYPRRLAALRGPLRIWQRSGLGVRLQRSRLASRMPPTMSAMSDLLPPLGRVEQIGVVTPAAGAQRARVGMLLGCVQRAFFSEVNAATLRVLAAEGCEVVAPVDQGCCGALSLHAGREAESLNFARRLIAAFEQADVDAVIINAAGCGSAMKDYGRLLADDPDWAGRAAAFSARCRDITEWLAELGPLARRHPLPLSIAYHDACHLAHAQGVRAQPRGLLSAIPQLELREIADPEICCGSAGIYNLVNPEPARQLGDRKAATAAATGADLLVAANPGCLLQIDAALQRQDAAMPLAHTVQVLDASIRGLSPQALTG